MCICTLSLSINSLSEVAISNKEVYHKYYPQLVSTLPMKDAIFLSHLLSLLPGDLKEKVETKSTAAEAASFFLDNMIKTAVESGNMESFDILLLKMETSDNINLKRLAQSIKQDLQKIKPVNGEIHMIDSTTYMCISYSCNDRILFQKCQTIYKPSKSVPIN